jgi:2-oxoisovalerate dehydrogenase E1 component beta subunit
MASMAQAIRLALHYAEENLGVTDVFGEDVGPPLGGVFTASQGLKTAWNSPLDERGIIGCAIGLALAGQRPVAEIQFCGRRSAPEFAGASTTRTASTRR